MRPPSKRCFRHSTYLRRKGRNREEGEGEGEREKKKGVGRKREREREREREKFKSIHFPFPHPPPQKNQIQPGGRGSRELNTELRYIGRGERDESTLTNPLTTFREDGGREKVREEIEKTSWKSEVVCNAEGVGEIAILGDEGREESEPRRKKEASFDAGELTLDEGRGEREREREANSGRLTSDSITSERRERRAERKKS